MHDATKKPTALHRINPHDNATMSLPVVKADLTRKSNFRKKSWSNKNRYYM